MTKAMMDDPRRIREENPFESMMERFDRAAQLLNLNPDLYAVMRVPNRELKVYIPVRLDSGRLEVFEGYRVQHNFARGPAKGGIRYSPDVTEGFNVRPYNWQGSVALQQELRPGVGLTANYFRRTYGNFQVTDNLRVTPADYDQFCVTAPGNDSRLPVAGQQICGFYDVKPSKVGQSQNLVRLAKHYGDQSEVYNGLDYSVNWRHRGLTLFAGATTGRTVTSQCFTVDAPVIYPTIVAPAASKMLQAPRRMPRRPQGARRSRPRRHRDPGNMGGNGDRSPRDWPSPRHARRREPADADAPTDRDPAVCGGRALLWDP